MDRTAPTHATHDQLLLARLYGGDVDELERSRALDQIATCQDCADVFADLGSIAAATAALPTPPRPRDFTLTEADAARVGRRGTGWGIFDWLGRTRALGGSMAAAGLAGLALVGALSVFGQGAGSAALTGQSTIAAQNTGGTPGEAAYNAASSVPDQNGGTTLAGPSSTGIPQIVAVSPVAPPASVPSASATGKLPPSDQQQAGSGKSTSVSSNSRPASVPSGSKSEHSGGGSSGPAGSTGSGGGPDPRSLALVAFAGLAILGALLLTVPRFAVSRAHR